MDTDNTNQNQPSSMPDSTPETAINPESSQTPALDFAADMGPAQTPTPPPTFAPAEPKKKTNSSLIVVIIFAILAVAGIGFGVYGMFLKPAEEKIVYQCEETEKSTTDDNSTTNGDNGVVTTDSAHFYLGELHTKINIPDDYVGKISYLYRNNGSVLFWVYTGEAAPTYVNPLSDDSYPLFAINESREAFSDEKYTYFEGTLVFTNENGTELYLHQTDFSKSANADTLRTLADEVMLTFVDSYQYSNF